MDSGTERGEGLVSLMLPTDSRWPNSPDVLMRPHRVSSLGHVCTHPTMPDPCFLVKRENMASKSPFQVQVSGARILAQKIIYASFRKLDTAGMGTCPPSLGFDRDLAHCCLGVLFGFYFIFIIIWGGKCVFLSLNTYTSRKV